MPGTIEFLAGLGVVLVVLAALGAMAQRWGVDSPRLGPPHGIRALVRRSLIMWQYYLLGHVMAQGRRREAAADRQATEARRAQRREPGTGRVAMLMMRARHHES